MRVTVHSVAGKMPAWVDTAVADYARRLPREIRIEWRNVPLARRSSGSARRGTEAATLRDREGAALLKGLTPDDHCVALDGGGKAWKTEELARQLKGWMMQGRGLSVLIGGPDGLSAQCLAAAQQRWSLGRLTLPHPLVRVVLVEQLYRAWTINAGHPYHRA